MDNHFFLAIEGVDGSGKSTVAYRLEEGLRLAFKARTINENTFKMDVLRTYEPHDPSLCGFFIRQALTKRIKEVPEEILGRAFALNRLDHCESYIKGFLKQSENCFVISDRYYLSSLVYQTQDGVLTFEDIMDLNAGAIRPDLIIFLNVDTKLCYKRMRERISKPRELFEANLNEMRERYLQAIEFLEAEENGDHDIRIIDANGSVEDVINNIIKELSTLERFNWLKVQHSLPIPPLKLNGQIDILSLAKDLFYKWAPPLPLSPQLRDDIEELKAQIDDYLANANSTIVETLFKNFVQIIGYKSNVDKEVLPYVKGFEVKHTMPGDVTLYGVAIILDSQDQSSTITNLVLNESSQDEYWDFILAFEKSDRESPYYRKGELIDAAVKYSSKFEKSMVGSPTVKIFTNDDLSKFLLGVVLTMFFDENTFHSNYLRPIILDASRKYGFEPYWLAAQKLTSQKENEGILSVSAIDGQKDRLE